MAVILYSLNVQKYRKVATSHGHARMQEALHPSMRPGKMHSLPFHPNIVHSQATAGWVKPGGDLKGADGPNVGQLGINKYCHLLLVRSGFGTTN
jgi:hypothetical protein